VIEATDERCGAILSALSEGVVVQDLNGRVEMSNDRAGRILGQALAPMATVPWMGDNWHAIHEDGSPFPGEAHPAMLALRTGQPVSGVVMGVANATGALTWISVNSRPVLRDGKICAVVSTLLELTPQNAAGSAALSGPGTGITARKQTEEALRESEARFRAVVENSYDGIIFADAAGVILYRSPSYIRLIGYSDDERVGHSGFELIHPDDLARVRKNWAALLSQGSAGRAFDFRIRHKDGTWRWLEVSTENLLDNPNVRAVVVIGRDITSRKEAEEALRQSEARFRAIVEASYDGFVFTDSQGVILYRSPSYEQLTGYSNEERVGHGLFELTHPDDLEVLQRARADLLEAAAPLAGLRYRFRHKDGAWRWFECSAHNLLGNPDVRAILWIDRDITNQLQAEGDLRKSEAKFRAIVENSHDGIVFNDANGQIMYRSPSYEQITGYTTEERLGRSGFDLVHPDDVDAARQSWLKVLHGGSGSLPFGNYRLRRKDGSWTWLESSAQNLLDNPNVQAIVITSREITERKQAEEALRQSEARFRAIVENSYEGFVFCDRDGGILYRSPSFQLIDGYTNEERQGRNAFENLHPDDLERGRQTWKNLLSLPGTYRGLPYRLRHKDGSWRWIESTALNLLDNPNVQAVVITIHDITERKKAEADLRLTNFVVESASVGILWGKLYGKFTHVNRRACEMTGYSPEELLGMSVEDLDAGRPRNEMEPMISKLREDKHQTFESLHWHKDGHRFPVEISASLLQFENTEYVVSFVRDITEQKRGESERDRLQNELAQSQKMESIGRLAGGVAHDFNNLLTVINGYSRMALAELRWEDPLRIQLAEINKAGERAAELTKQLLAYSRKQVLQARVLDLNRIVIDMESMLGRLVGEDVELRLKLSRENPLVQADPHQLEQVIMNLAVNAREAMPEGGQLGIETGLVELKGRGLQALPEAVPGRYAVLRVSDTGAGMDEATRQQIFEPFFTTKGQGTGLGLSMVQGIVAQSAGYIQVESEPGRGTTFEIYLPAQAEARAEAEKPMTIQALRGRETVLVVEDQADVRDYTVAALKGYGYRAIAAANAGEALIICEQEGARIDLVLTDVVMPHMNGWELVERLAKLRPGIKALYMSGYAEQARALGEGTHFIEKPFSPESLARRIRGALA